MYINDTHIGFYLLVAIVGLGIGQFVDWMNERLAENKKIFSLDIFRKYKIDFKPNYILMIVTSLIYVGLVYKFGVQDRFIENLNLIKYIILTPMILSALTIDCKSQIIPNRLNLTMLEVGLVIAFVYGISNVVITIDMLLGMLAGAGIFLIIMLIGNLAYGKQSMGLGDIKFMGALGLYFGVTNITVISIISFLLGAIFAIILMITRKKKKDEYMPFGPFIAIAALMTIFIPFEILLNVILTVLTFGMYNR